MNGTRPKVTMHVVSSLDGFIARKDNSVSWLISPEDAYPPGVPESSAGELVKTIDCYVLGSHTYEHALELGWPYGDTPTVVLTSRNLSSERATVEFHTGDLERLVTDVLASRFRNAWVVGGAELCQSFLRLGLVDEMRLSVAPVLLGDGLRLFDSAGPESRWRLLDVLAYNTGFVEVLYGLSSTKGVALAAPVLAQ
jgi:dihydrofolate reductase